MGAYDTQAFPTVPPVGPGAGRRAAAQDHFPVPTETMADLTHPNANCPPRECRFVATNPPLEWNMRPRVEGIRVCMANAKRLRLDARRCRSPAKLALVELSLEQVALGWMLYLRILVNVDPVFLARLQSGISLPDLPAGSPGWKVALAGQLTRLDDGTILRAFRRHRQSLVELDGLLRTVEEMLPFILEPGNVSPESLRRAPIQYRLGLRVFGGRLMRGTMIESVRKTHAALRALDLGRLDETVKNSSLYVRIDAATGACLLPETDKAAFWLMERSSHTLANFLKGLLIGARDSPSRPTAVSG